MNLLSFHPKEAFCKFSTMEMIQNGGPRVNGFATKKKLKGIDQLAWQRISYKALFALVFITPAAVQYVLGFPFWCYPLAFALLLVPTFGVFMVTFNRICVVEGGMRSTSTNRFIDFHDPGLAAKYVNRKIPMVVLYEAYADGKLDFKGDLLESLENRHQFSTFELTFDHVRFLIFNFLPELIFHSKVQDAEQVCDHYDRGNDFYNGFLGPMMIYTSGICRNDSDTLEEMQLNKLKAVCEKCQLKKGERHLDIGCGWGALVNYAVENRGTLSTGVTLAKRQVEWAEDEAMKKNLNGRSQFLCMDYRDIPSTKYDKITCLEMAEHVGVRKFQSFLAQVREMLEDDGIFFLQIAGLRRTWQWEDFIWGLFMAKYIFPGADASCPLGWIVTELERAGFEIHSSETIGVHYSLTINRWYDNWMKPANQKAMIEKYGRIVRIWNIFLAWSTIIARQGNSTCTQLVCHKNLNVYDRLKLFSVKSK